MITDQNIHQTSLMMTTIWQARSDYTQWLTSRANKKRWCIGIFIWPLGWIWLYRRRVQYETRLFAHADAVLLAFHTDDPAEKDSGRTTDIEEEKDGPSHWGDFEVIRGVKFCPVPFWTTFVGTWHRNKVPHYWGPEPKPVKTLSMGFGSASEGVEHVFPQYN